MNKRALILIIVIAIFLLIISLFFPTEKEKDNYFLYPIKTTSLSIPEPSGLYFDEGNKSLWTVSDENSHVYNIDLEGNVIDSFIVEGFDLEGITIIEDSIVVTILERDRILVFLDKKGNEISRIELNISGEPNKGIEGIAYYSKINSFLIVNEKMPRALYIVDRDGNIVDEFKLNFAKDFSGLYYEKRSDRVWIISDENSEIFLCNIQGEILRRYSINIEQIEGIAIDEENSIIYLVSDPLEKLYVFKLP